MRQIFSLITMGCFVLYCGDCYAQVKDTVVYPELDNVFPNYIHIQNYLKSSDSYTDYDRKPTVLVFWAKYCVSCIAAFPKYNQLNHQFRDSINFLLVAPDDDSHREIFESYKEKMGLNIKSIFNSTLFNNRSARGIPHIFWIDSEGVLESETITISERLVQDYLSNPSLLNLLSPKEPIANSNVNDSLLILNNIGGEYESKILFRSLLTKWEEGMSENGITSIAHPTNLKDNKAEFLKVTIKELYELAYLGRINATIPGFAAASIIEVGESSNTLNNEYYCYSLKVPGEKASSESLIEVMQNDLKNYFGFNVTFEDINYPCYELTPQDNSNIENLISNSEKTAIQYSPIEIKFNRVKFSALIEWLNYILINKPMIVNKTGFDDDTLIDIELTGTIMDFEYLEKELSDKYKLNLIPSEVTLRTMVIRN